ncbi:tetratricopeptide repeat protein [Shewanella sp. GXUN23E]|uniref:tetratricopeptide repeat protein n=1 Tax=Shewanella sp. GXUN23E TaxID=3422498 RepID=UPI003D7E9BB9
MSLPLNISLAALLLCCSASQANPGIKPVALDNTVCTHCHSAQHQAWQASDHARAMALATSTPGTPDTPDKIAADFSDIKVSHFDQQARFYLHNGQPMADIDDGNQQQTFEVLYSFGYYPLQQYLVSTGKGRLQVLPFAWDSRPEQEGGQRWYHNYATEQIDANDRLHWRQPLQNWNGMCADCHSDGLVRHYDPDKDEFATRWDNINVGCLSCHGDMQAHARDPQTALSQQASLQIQVTGKGSWQRDKATNIASWQGPPRDNRFMENCFACHSLRTPLTDGFKANVPFLEQFSPQLVNAPLYYADGQIKEEVYVYGSFMQSKMAAAGVNCQDCHDSHTMQVKVPGNGLCLQCHNPDAYNVAAHLNHEAGSKGSQCVDCHMPQTRYMGVDDRRDHSFSIPRPALTAQFGIPNACERCHSDKGTQWAIAQVNKAYPNPKAQLSANQLRLIELRAGAPISAQAHRAIIDDASLPVLSRASAIELLPITHNELPSEWFSRYLHHAEPLLRLAAAAQGGLLPQSAQQGLITPLLDDNLRAVRVAAARTLSMNQPQQEPSSPAISELNSANRISAWRGEGRMNQALMLLATGRWQEASDELQASIRIDPFFAPAYVNLADIYRATGQTAKAGEIFRLGLANNPQSADLHYGYGLQLIRAKTYQEAEQHLSQAATLAPDNGQYVYGYLLALDNNGKQVQALKILKTYLQTHGADPQLHALGLALARKAGDWVTLNQLLQSGN